MHTSRSSITSALRACVRTVFKSRFYGFAAQKYSINYNLKTAAELGVEAVEKPKIFLNFSVGVILFKM